MSLKHLQNRERDAPAELKRAGCIIFSLEEPTVVWKRYLCMFVVGYSIGLKFFVCFFVSFYPSTIASADT